jgi:23S rRNA (uracil1939-C5)-methyltransferase
MVRKGDLVELEIESAAYGGVSVGRLERLVVFVPHSVPGDRVRARIIRKKRNHVEAVVVEVLHPSPDRVSPRCRYFGVCGGCTLQNTAYGKQLEFKTEQVRALLERVGKLPGLSVAPTLPSREQYYYRNKMEFTFGTQRWLTSEEIDSRQTFDREFALGLHIPKRFDRILDLEVCYLQSRMSAGIVNFVRRYARKREWTAFDVKKHVGYLRNLVIRTAVLPGETMVNLVTTTSKPDRLQELTEALLGEFPEMKTVLNSINPGPSPVAAGEEIVYFGEGVIRERIGPLLFEITPTSFLQPNSRQAEVLYSVIRDMAQSRQSDRVYDLFCGVGGIGLFLAPGVGTVVGVESHPESVRLARLNAQRNGISNCEFHVADATEALRSDFIERHGAPDLLILDPPRSGLHPDVSKLLVEVLPGRIVYTSCNPATQARDLSILAEYYEVTGIQPVDMFPQTYHIEAVAALTLKERQQGRSLRTSPSGLL